MKCEQAVQMRSTVASGPQRLPRDDRVRPDWESTRQVGRTDLAAAVGAFPLQLPRVTILPEYPAVLEQSHAHVKQ